MGRAATAGVTVTEPAMDAEARAWRILHSPAFREYRRQLDLVALEGLASYIADELRRAEVERDEWWRRWLARSTRKNNRGPDRRIKS